MNYEKEYNKVMQKVGMLRQLVVECDLTKDQIYKELNEIAPLMSKEQKKEFDNHIAKTFNKII